MNLKDCHNFSDFRKLAKKNLPSPIFHYIDGAADDEITYIRNTKAFDECYLVPKVLRSVENINLETKILGKKISLPFFLSPTALQRLFHHQGELAVAKAAEKFNTFFSSLSLWFNKTKSVYSDFISLIKLCLKIADSCLAYFSESFAMLLLAFNPPQ